jgi:hypothetical protein
MEATLKFNLPEEKEEFENARKGGDYRYGIDEFGNWLRNQIKHGNYSEAEFDLLEKVREEFWKIMNDND